MVEIKSLASDSSGNAHFITDKYSPLLLDVGIPWKLIQRGLNFKTSELAGILISHAHADHCKGVKDAIKSGIDCYMSQATADAIGVVGHRVKIIQAKRQFKLGPWTVLPFGVEHDVETYGYLLVNQNGARVLYLTDTAYCRYRFKNLTHILLEVNHSLDILRANVDAGIISADLKNRIIKTHMGLDTAKEFLKANDLSRVESIHLIHLSNDNSDAERFKKEVMELTGKPTYIA